MRHTGGALAGSAFTTMAGFGVLVTSSLVPFRRMDEDRVRNRPVAFRRSGRIALDAGSRGTGGAAVARSFNWVGSPPQSAYALRRHRPESEWHQPFPPDMDVSRSQSEATRLLPLAQRVLTRYAFEISEIEHLATHSNVMFRVVADNGHQMVLRLGTPHANYRSNIEIEVSWLDAINRETHLNVVEPIATTTGKLIVDEFDETIEKERACVLFSWVPGRPMGDTSGSFAYRLLGAMCAALQEHGRRWMPPAPERMRLWDVVFYYRQDFDPIVIDNPAYSHLFDDSSIKLIRKAAMLAQGVMDDSYASARPQVVHGDLHEWNVHMAASRLYAFDFEDVMLALPAQDVAISLYSSRDSDMRADIRSAFRKGFESVAPWPVIDERQLDGFHAARQVMLMNYAGRTLPGDEAASYINGVMPWLERYVKRYA